MSNIRPLFILPNLGGGGAEKVAMNVVGGLISRGVPSGLYLMSAADIAHEIPKNLRLGGNFVGALDDTPTRGRDSGIAGLVARARQATTIVGALEIKTYPVAVILGLFLRKPVVLWLHKDLKPFLERKRGWQRWLYRRVLAWNVSFADRVVAVSDGVARSIRNEVPAALGKTTCLFNPNDFANIETALDSDDVPEEFGPQYVLAVGRMTQQKGFDVLLDAFAAVAPQFDGLKLIILGDGELRDVLEARVKALGLEDRVRMPGFLRPYRIMAQASVLVMSSRFEGLPTVLIEALYCGTPVVSTDCPSGPAEILCGGELGILTPTDAPEALAQAINKTLLSVDAASERARRRARAEDFSFDRVMPEWCALFHGLMKYLNGIR